MSQENVEIVRRLLALYNERDFESLLDAYHPDAEIVTLVSGTYRGRSGARQVALDNSEMMQGNRLDPIDVVAVGDHVVAELGVAGAGRVSGIAPVDERITTVATFSDGLIIRQETFRTRAEALKAAGLSE